MTKENKLLIIFAATLTLVSIVFLIGFRMYKKDKEVKVYKSFLSEATSIKHEDMESGLIIRKTTIYKGKDIIGYAYLGSDEVEGIPMTKGFKELRIEVIIDTNNKIQGARIDYSEHTPEYMTFIRQYFDALPNTDLVDYKLVDEVAGASAKSMPIVRDILDQVTKLVTGQEPNPKELPDPYVDLFDNKETVEVDTTFTPNEKVLKKEIVKDVDGNVLGSVYTLTGKSTTPLHDYDESDENFITLLVGVDPDNKFTGVLVLETDHTTGFYDKHDAYFDSLIGTLVSEAPVDNISGATISRTIIRELIDALKAVLA